MDGDRNLPEESGNFLIWATYMKNFQEWEDYLFMAVLGLHCCVGFSLVVVSRGYS